MPTFWAALGVHLGLGEEQTLYVTFLYICAMGFPWSTSCVFDLLGKANFLTCMMFTPIHHHHHDHFGDTSCTAEMPPLALPLRSLPARGTKAVSCNTNANLCMAALLATTSICHMHAALAVYAAEQPALICSQIRLLVKEAALPIPLQGHQMS